MLDIIGVGIILGFLFYLIYTATYYGVVGLYELSRMVRREHKAQIIHKDKT